MRALGVRGLAYGHLATYVETDPLLRAASARMEQLERQASRFEQTRTADLVGLAASASVSLKTEVEALRELGRRMDERLGRLGAAPGLSDTQILDGITANADHLWSPRCLFLTALIPLIGLSFQDPKTRDAYIKNLWPYDPWPAAYSMAASESSCGITTEVGWRYAGVDDPLLYLPYGQRVAKGQYTVAQQKKFATEVGAWVDCVSWVEGTPTPDVGDAVIIGCASCGADWARNVYAGEHEFTVCLIGSDGQVHSIDGGQPGIAIRSRGLVQVFTGTNKAGQRTGELWFGVVNPKTGAVNLAADGRPQAGRRCVGYTNVSKLRYRAAQGECGIGTKGKLENKLLSPWALALLGLGVAGGVYLYGPQLLAWSRRWL